MWFGVLLPFAHFGVPVMSIITRSPYFGAFWTSSSRSFRRYAGSSPSAGDEGRLGAIIAQLAVVWTTDAPAVCARARFSARSAAQRKLGSSKNPIGIRGAAETVAAGAATRITRAKRTRRRGLSTGITPSWDANRGTVAKPLEGRVKEVARPAPGRKDSPAERAKR